RRGAQPIEDRAFAGAEGFMTLVADEALLLTRMDTDIAHACLASGVAVPIGAEYRCGIHDMLLLAVRGSVPRGVCRDPHFRYKCASPRLSAELPYFGQLNNLPVLEWPGPGCTW